MTLEPSPQLVQTLLVTHIRALPLLFSIGSGAVKTHFGVTLVRVWLMGQLQILAIWLVEKKPRNFLWEGRKKGEREGGRRGGGSGTDICRAGFGALLTKALLIEQGLPVEWFIVSGTSA